MEKKQNAGEAQPVLPMFIALVFSFYWTSEVISNTLHTTVSGVVGRWYFKALGGTSEALTRSLTKSFGSVCFGSFIMAAVRTLSFICECVKSAAEDGDNLVVMVIAMVALCFIR